MIDIFKIAGSPELNQKVKLEVSASDLLEFSTVLMAASREQGKTEGAKNTQDRLLTREETAKMLSVTLSTLWEWDRKKYLLPVKIGRRVFYRYRDIMEKINQ
ncbi:MAG: helix-turn-helix domain-containing protein [Tannerella sp.]|jgi:predicted DNA-binding transcriptional regulator AlpA|nr:helix-turn-helix domain-containing protein [Tannerella sp.]